MGKAKDSKASDSDSSEEEYVVEKIVDRRERKGKIEYLLKVVPKKEGSKDKDKKEEKKKPKPSSTTGSGSSKRKDSDADNDGSDDDDKDDNASIKSSKSKSTTAAADNDATASDDGMNGFEKGYTPEKILGATEANNELLFLIQWKDKDKAQLVSSKEARKHCPQLVIDFYEERLIWQSPDATE
ncbi:conserved hypothetical protein [Culex quinquefasciatus]|uniref:Chromo domain-containing protein n=1 Tax=Culex quinquefasciatus TaxID=7176 RepID=B0X6D8_CULQU|nr:conserved hypothetical protein [Culex quinquefasciatus]|eukprot:XP_001865210.1 conserved hypothetical protein [Culex quinquefasciatus]